MPPSERSPTRVRVPRQVSPNAVPGVYERLWLWKLPSHRRQITAHSSREVCGRWHTANASSMQYVPAHTNTPDLERIQALNMISMRVLLSLQVVNRVCNWFDSNRCRICFFERLSFTSHQTFNQRFWKIIFFSYESVKSKYSLHVF